MVNVLKEIMIKATPKTIWTLMIQHLKYPEKKTERGPEWDDLVIRDIKGVALTSVRSGIGVKTRWYYKFYFYTFKWDDEVVEWEELNKITWKSISTWDMIDSFTIEPENSETRLIYEMDYTPPYGILGKIWYRLFVHKHLEKHLEYTVLQMKKDAEAIEKFKGSQKNRTTSFKR
jgi:uncharacterized membrane protein